MNKTLVVAVSDLNDEEAVRIVREAIDHGEDPANILSDCQEAMRIVGDRYEKSEYFLPELIFSGEIVKEISDIIKPMLGSRDTAGTESKRAGKIVLGTVHGDIHNIGKDIVKFLLDISDFEVHDLGIDVPEEKFVEAIKEVKPQVVGLSGLTTMAYDVMKSTIDAIKKAGLRDEVKIMIGGGQVNEIVKNYAAADAFGQDAMAAVRLAKEWIPGK
jgi:methanogenic corrinoid protein MtbC1